MNPKEKILRTELVSAGAALLCCLLLYIACFLLAGLPSASLILLAAALPLSLVILPCALTWYSGRFCWAAPIFLTLGFILIPSSYPYFLYIPLFSFLPQFPQSGVLFCLDYVHFRQLL